MRECFEMNRIADACFRLLSKELIGTCISSCSEKNPRDKENLTRILWGRDRASHNWHGKFRLGSSQILTREDRLFIVSSRLILNKMVANS